MMINDKLEPDVAREIVMGEQDRLNSAFYLSYNMILNLLRIEAISPEYMLERCFHQFQTAASVPSLEKDLMALQQERQDMVIADEATVKDYYNSRKQVDTYVQHMRAVMQHPNYCLEFLQPGRLVRIYNPKQVQDDVLEGLDFGWGVVTDFTKRRAAKAGEPDFAPQESYFVDVLLNISGDSDEFAYTQPTGEMPNNVFPDTGKTFSRFDVVPCLLTCIKTISQIRVFMPKDLTHLQDREQVRKHLTEVQRRFPDGVPTLDPLENMNIEDESFIKLLRKIEILESRLLSNPLHGSPLLPDLYKQYHAKMLMGEKIKEKKREISKAHSIAQMDELKSRKRVLRRLGFINDSEVVQLKARVACEISSTEGHELVLAELLFDRFFNELTPEVIAAVLSCFILDERLKAENLKPELDKPYREIVAKARVVVKVSNECKIDVNEETYVASLKWELMETIHAWASGKTFAEIW